MIEPDHCDVETKNEVISTPTSGGAFSRGVTRKDI